MTRKALDWATRFPTIAAALEVLRVDKALLDGEVVSEDDRGIPHFSDLQADLKSGRRDRLRYHVFDLLHLDGFDLTRATLLDRKSLLRKVMARPRAGSPLRYSEHSEEDGAMMLKHACRMGLEGIVSKRKDLSYRPGRGEHWRKIKCVHAQELVILGYVPSTAGAGFVGSLQHIPVELTHGLCVVMPGLRAGAYTSFVQKAKTRMAGTNFAMTARAVLNNRDVLQVDCRAPARRSTAAPRICLQSHPEKCYPPPRLLGKSGLTA